MTLRQKILKFVYPVSMAFRSLRIGKKILRNENYIEPSTSFYELSLELNDGKIIPLKKYKGKKVLLVNTASNCGYTAQYEELQKLSVHFKKELEVIAFPANDFKHQERGTDNEVARFCKENFGLSFPIAKKSKVIKSAEQNEVFYWLTHKKRNGWNDKMPSWNFSKYLVNEQGTLTHYFDASVSPMAPVVVKAISQKLETVSV